MRNILTIIIIITLICIFVLSCCKTKKSLKNDAKGSIEEQHFVLENAIYQTAMKDGEI